MVAKRQIRRPALVIDDDEDEATRVYAGSLTEAFDEMNERWPDERPGDSWPDTRTGSGMALSRTLRPLAAGLRSFPFAYVFSIAALGMSGAAWYMSRTAPVEAIQAPAAAPKPTEPLAPAPAAAPASAQIAPAASVVATKAIVQAPARKAPIDVMSLPVAPPAPNRTPVRPAR